MNNNLMTLGTLAERLGIKIHRAEYLVRSRHVQPAGTAGRYRLFDGKTLEKLQRELKRAKSNE